MKKPTLKKPNIKKQEVKRAKPKLVPFSQSISNKIIESYDQGGEALVALKKALFDNTNTNEWLATFRKMQGTLDKIRASERLKLMRYVYAPDFAEQFVRTNDPNDWIHGMTKDEISKLMCLLATEYNHIYKGSIPKTLNAFKAFKKQPIDSIVEVFQKIHGKETD